MFKNIIKVLFGNPSEACRKLYSNVFPQAKIVTQYHESARHLDHQRYPVAEFKIQQKPTLNVVVIGALSKIKGADLLEDVARQCAKQGLNIEFELIGYGYRELIGHPKANLTVSGRYKESKLVSMLQDRHAKGKADVIWFTALWPETYSYTLSAAIEAGLPVIAPDIGAFAERLYGRERSWILPWQSSAQQFIDVFEGIANKGAENSALTAYSSQQPPASQYTVYGDQYLTLLRAADLYA